MTWGSTELLTGLYANNVYYIILIQNLNNGGRGEADQDAGVRDKVKILNMKNMPPRACLWHSAGKDAEHEKHAPMGVRVKCRAWEPSQFKSAYL